MGIAIIVLAVYGGIGLAVIAGLIYVICKRIRDAAGENFEQREN